MDIVIPAETLMVRFANIAADTIRQVRCLKHSLRRLTQARDLLLPRLMNGEIAV